MDSEFKFTDGTTLPVGTMYGIGQNYAKHAKEMGGRVPKEPVVFIKPPAAYVADGGAVRLPDFSGNVHHEVELVVVIGKDCANIDKASASEYIAGFAVGIDVTLRDLQAKAKADGKPWAVAKGFATSAPISKVVPINEIADYSDLMLSLSVNGDIRQSASAGEMTRSVDMLIAYLSNVFTLRAGDCVFTGTPEGVGQIRKGDKIRAELTGYAELNVTVE